MFPWQVLKDAYFKKFDIWKHDNAIEDGYIRLPIILTTVNFCKVDG